MMKDQPMHTMPSFLVVFSMWLIFLLLSYLPGYATTWSVLYGGSGHEEGVDLKPTGDGNFIAVGNASSFGGQNQVWVLKVDADGRVIWQKAYQNAEKETYDARAIDLTQDGGYIVAGHATTCYESEPLCQGFGWLLKIDSDGNILWQKGYKDTEGYGGSFAAVQTTEDSGFVAVGSGGTLGTVTPRSSLWVVKVDKGGALQWQYQYHHENISDSYATAVQQTADGGYIVAGTLISGITGWSDGYDVWVLKLSGSGTVDWHNMYSGPAGFDIGWSVRQTADGGYVVAGQTEDATGYGSDGLLLKLDRNGGIEWQKNYESGEGDRIRIVRQMTDGGYIIGGLYQGGGLAVGLDSNGGVDWQRRYQADAFLSLEKIAGGFVAVSAGSATREGATGADLLIVKTDETGGIHNCLSVSDGNIQAFDATLALSTFPLTVTAPGMLIIDTLAAPADTDVSPIEVCPYKTLTLSLSSTQVHAASSPEGLACVAKTCSGRFSGGSELMLTAYPMGDSALIAWGSDCSSCGSNETCTVILDADKACTAVFTAEKGDIDRSGAVDLLDAVLALQVMAGMNPDLGIGYAASGADIDGNGNVGMAEAIFVLQKEAEIRN